MTKLYLAAAAIAVAAVFAFTSTQPAVAAMTNVKENHTPHSYTPAPKKPGPRTSFSPYTPMPTGSVNQAKQAQGQGKK